MATDEADRRRAHAILEAIRLAWCDLRGPGPPKKRAAAASMHFSAYTEGLLGPQVRDVYNARGVRAVGLALKTLESLARAFAEDG